MDPETTVGDKVLEVMKLDFESVGIGTQFLFHLFSILDVDNTLN